MVAGLGRVVGGGRVDAVVVPGAVLLGAGVLGAGVLVVAAGGWAGAEQAASGSASASAAASAAAAVLPRAGRPRTVRERTRCRPPRAGELCAERAAGGPKCTRRRAGSRAGGRAAARAGQASERAGGTGPERPPMPGTAYRGSVPLFECVPNFSEGRDPAKIARIAGEAEGRPGVAVLDVHRDPDHHRSVVTLAGDGPALVEALLAMMHVATGLIDLNTHRGVHPRMGATDVVPFVPLGDATMQEAMELAVALGERVWAELRVPVYLYGEAARRPERHDLAVVRAGGFEGIRNAISTDPGRQPDVGDPRIHPTAGAVAIGARPVLVAYNAYLTTPDVAVAKRVARAVRGRDGGLAGVKALGFEIRQRGRAQVSMNLTDYRRTPMHRALEAVRREAERYGAAVEETEVVGLVPEDALLDAAEYHLQLNGFDRRAVLERRLRAAPLHGESLADLATRTAARTPAPGGGSASAATAALGAALGEMVAAYAAPAGAAPPPAVSRLRAARHRLLVLVDADAAAYEATVRASRAAREEPGPAADEAWTDALRRAAEVPLETARLATSCRGELQAIEANVPPALRSDRETALALLEAACRGALSSVAANLHVLRERGAEAADLEGAAAELGRRDSPPQP